MIKVQLVSSNRARILCSYTDESEDEGKQKIIDRVQMIYVTSG